MRALWSTLRETPVTLSLVFAVVILSFILLAVEITPFSELLTAQPVPLVDGARSHAHQTDRRIFQPNITWTADGTLTTEATSTRSPWSWQATLATALSGQGFLQVQRHNGEVEEYGISLFHQLHCLQMIRSLLLNQSWASHHHDAGQVDDGPHWAHCVDYLAQSILCSADDTIEPPVATISPSGDRSSKINGIGVVHECRRNLPAVWKAVNDSGKRPVRESRLKGGDSIGSVFGS